MFDQGKRIGRKSLSCGVPTHLSRNWFNYPGWRFCTFGCRMRQAYLREPGFGVCFCRYGARRASGGGYNHCSCKYWSVGCVGLWVVRGQHGDRTPIVSPTAADGIRWRVSICPALVTLIPRGCSCVSPRCVEVWAVTSAEPSRTAGVSAAFLVHPLVGSLLPWPCRSPSPRLRLLRVAVR